MELYRVYTLALLKRKKIQIYKTKEQRADNLDGMTFCRIKKFLLMMLFPIEQLVCNVLEQEVFLK